MNIKKIDFNKANPIWLLNGAREMNTTVLFEAVIGSGEKTELHLTGCSDYQVFINGNFVFFGPARAGKGFFRVDKLPIERYLTEKENKITVLVCGYNISSYYLPDDHPFLCAEFTDGENVFGATGSDAWKAYLYTEKLQKTQIYSFQRTFCEVYDHRENMPLSTKGKSPALTAVYPIDSFIEREVSYPELPYEEIRGFIDGGSAFYNEKKDITDYSPLFKEADKGFKTDEIELLSEREAKRIELTSCGTVPAGRAAAIPENSYLTAEMKQNTTGFIRLDISCDKETELVLTFDEILTDSRIDFTRMCCANVVIYRLGKGKYSLITAEPYTFKYLNIIALHGAVKLEGAGVTRLDFNASEIKCSLSPRADEQIAGIYDAAIETFRQNTLDIYMDCPSRERAGWLCDSFFTARVEKLLTGKSTVEHSFLENFLMPERFENLPDGMLPMCYPADHVYGNFIPNWAMWYCIELKEYLERTGDRGLIDSARDNMYALLSYFRRFENPDGLLERLEKWVFVEWSKCNELVQDINYPSNMLYYMFKNTLCELYGDKSLATEAAELKKTIRAKSRIGIFFCDNAVYNDKGEAVLSGERTETCQYYAFFTGVATPSEDSELWNTMISDFGPDRHETGKWKDIHFANAFIGNYLRLELLMKEGLTDKLEANIRGYFNDMAVRTGTLWENMTPTASCNHCFASHVLVWLDQLGYIDKNE